MAAAESQLRVVARARRLGVALRSRDLTTALSLVALSLCVHHFGAGVLRALSALVRAGLAAPADPAGAGPALRQAALSLLHQLWPLLVALPAAALLSMAAQSLWGGAAPSPFAVSRRARAGGSDGGIGRFWTVIKLALLGLLGLGLFVDLSRPFVSAMSSGLPQLRAAVAGLDGGLMRVALFALVLAALDMLVQRQRLVLSLSLDPAEQQRERRAEEGDPTVRAQLRGRARESGGQR